MTSVFGTAQTNLTALRSAISEMQQLADQAQKDILSMQRRLNLAGVNEDEFARFMQKPYRVEKVRPNQWRLLIPKFINFAAGWPVTSDDVWNIYQISPFIHMLTPLPDWLLREIDFDAPDYYAHIEGDYLIIDDGDPETVWEKLGRGRNFSRREGNRLRMKPASQFDIKRQLIRQGVAYFTPQPVNPEDLRPSRGDIQLRDHQKRDFDRFMEYGAASVFATGGAGKTYFSLYACDVLKGRKLILVDSVVLKQQWEARLRLHVPHALDEVEITTYQSLHRRRPRGPFTLLIQDEAQTLPSNQGLIAAGIPAKYRLALSATPWREDGNEDIIPALGGLPLGQDWPSTDQPNTTIWVVRGHEDKIKAAQGILAGRTNGKTMLFVYKKELGRRVAAHLGLPFFSGDTRGNRLNQIEQADTFVISAIGTKGISANVTRVIELDWHGGRMEAGQRLLRLQHGEGRGELHVIMTRGEYNQEAGKRRLSAFYALSDEIEVRAI